MSTRQSTVRRQCSRQFVTGELPVKRRFFLTTPLGLIGAAVACRGERQGAPAATPESATSTPTTPGAPPTFGTGPLSGPPVSPATFAEAEKLAQVTMTDAERDMAAASWRRTLAPLLERRVGPRKVALEPELAPATIWNPRLGAAPAPARDRFVRSRTTDAAL